MIKKKLIFLTGLLILSSCSHNYGVIPNYNSNVNSYSTENQDITNSIQDISRYIFNEYDTNHDNFIELNEIKFAPLTFKSLDINKDNRISFDEVQPKGNRLTELVKHIKNFYWDTFHQADRDENNLLSKDEIDNNEGILAFKNNFKIYTQDGFLTFQEFEQCLNNSAVSIMDSVKKEQLSQLNNKTPVFLVHGYFEPSWYFMYGIYKNLKKRGWPVYTVNLFPNFADIKESSAFIKQKIEDVVQQTGKGQIDVVCHSLGGLITRYYIQNLDGVNKIRNLVTIATPHYGTYTALFGIGESAKQMKPESSFLQELNKNGDIYGNIKYTSLWTNTDEMVIPASSAKLIGAPEHLINYTGHLTILFSNRTYNYIREAIK